jgi:hypothetical protein
MNLKHPLMVAWAVLAGCDRGSHTPEHRGWYYTVDTVRSEMDGQVKYTSTLQVFGDEGAEGAPRDKVASLVFDCRAGVTPSASLLTDDPLDQGEAEVRIRLDSLPAVSWRGFSGSYNKGGLVLLGEMRTFLDTLSGHQRVLVEYAGANRVGKTIAEFRVAGLDTLRTRFVESCGKR